MDYGERLAEGKTKIIYAHPTEAHLAVMVQKDAISAGDGARRHMLPGKGALSGRTAANVYALLNRAGIPTHYIGPLSDAEMIVRRCAMIPLEVVMRRRATGSYLKRHPDTAEGQRFDPVLVEFFLKDDARHDPQIEPEGIVQARLATNQEVAAMVARGRQVFDLLERAWGATNVELVDLKIEFGRSVEGELLVADMVDNDSWRLWPGGDKAAMLDKQIYRNMPEVTDEGLHAVKAAYEQVAALTDGFAGL